MFFLVKLYCSNIKEIRQCWIQPRLYIRDCLDTFWYIFTVILSELAQFFCLCAFLPSPRPTPPVNPHAIDHVHGSSVRVLWLVCPPSHLSPWLISKSAVNLWVKCESVCWLTWGSFVPYLPGKVGGYYNPCSTTDGTLPAASARNKIRHSDAG